MTNNHTIVIGNVLRADIRGFVVASRIPEPEVPTFGTFVRAPIQQGQTDLIGIVHNIRLQDDPFLRTLAATIAPDDPQYAEVIQDQRENRALPVEISVAAIGYRMAGGGSFIYGFPPQPPMVLYSIAVCSDQEVKAITASPEFMRTLLDAPDLPTDELIPAALERAAALRPASEVEHFLVDSGRYLARYLGRDPVRLDRILRRLESLYTAARST